VGSERRETVRFLSAKAKLDTSHASLLVREDCSDRRSSHSVLSKRLRLKLRAASN